MSFTKQDIVELTETLNAIKQIGDYRVVYFDGGNTYYKIYKNGKYEKIDG